MNADLYEAEFKRIFFENYWPGLSSEAPIYKEAESSFFDNFTRRYEQFKLSLIPWLERMVGLRGSRIAEIGSGIGSSTEALVELVDHVDCFEIDARSVPLAKLRLAHKGYRNFDIHQRAFDEAAVSSIDRVDGVFLPAVLEHTTFSECLDILRIGWSVLKPGGWLCVVDTPNRFCPMDLHTAQLPFFASLPAEVRIAYAHHSPRTHFAADFSQRPTWSEDDYERLTRWGSGISYHEFELALGQGIHDWVVADGYEREIEALIGVLPEDLTIMLQFKMFAPHVHKAFTRRAFHLILRKPIE